MKQKFGLLVCKICKSPRADRSFFLSKHMKLGLSEAESTAVALQEAKAFREELVRKGTLKPKPCMAKTSSVRGVFFHQTNGTYNVQMRNPSAKKTVWGGSFKVKEEAETRARELAKELGLHEVVVPVKPLSELLHFEPLGPEKNIKWSRGEQGWRASYKAGGKQKNMRFRPKSFSPKEVKKAWKQAVAWRKQQEKQPAEPGNAELQECLDPSAQRIMLRSAFALRAAPPRI